MKQEGFMSQQCGTKTFTKSGERQSKDRRRTISQCERRYALRPPVSHIVA